MTSRDDLTEINGKNILIGTLNSHLEAERTDAFLAKKRAQRSSELADFRHEMELNVKAEEAALKLKQVQAELEETKALLKETDDVVLEWMQSNEALKRMAKKYAKRLQISGEEGRFDFNQTALELSEEDPLFANTKLSLKIKQAQGKS